jgi:arginine exporter protein ArgO
MVGRSQTDGMAESIFAGLWAGYAVAIPVGALAVLLVSLTARTSFRVGASGALGVATADGLYATAAVLGGAALANAIRPVAGSLRWLAAAVLIAIAIRVALNARHGPEIANDFGGRQPALGRPGRAYLGFLGLTLLNPWAIIYFAALALGWPDDTGAPAQVAFTAAVFTASASWQLLLATSGALLGRTLTRPRARQIAALASSLVITALAISMIP